MNRKDEGELLGVSLVTVHNWSKDGALKAYKIWNRVRFIHSDIEQTLLSSNKKKRRNRIP
ncbi:MAG: helix-turn-helix domain-containing protein [Gillisia sp.]